VSFYQLHHRLLQRRLRAGPGLQHRTFRSTTAAATTEDLIDLGVLKQLHHASSVGGVYYSATFDTLAALLRSVDITNIRVFQRKLCSHLSPFQFHQHTLSHAHFDTTTPDFQRSTFVIISAFVLYKILVS
jgi:hypothetical protein